MSSWQHKLVGISLLTSIAFAGCLTEGPTASPLEAAERDESKPATIGALTLAQQKSQFEASLSFKRGEELYHRGNPTEALERFNNALALNPAHEGAKEYIQRCNELLGHAQSHQDPIDQYKKLKQISLKQKTLEIKQLIAKASNALNQSRYSEAHQRATAAIARLKQLPVKRPGITEQILEAKAIQQKATAEKSAHKREVKDNNDKLAREMIRTRQENDASLQKRELKRFLELAKDAMERSNFPEAHLHANKAIEKYPTDKRSHEIADLVYSREKSWKKEWIDVQEQREWDLQLNQVYQKAIPRIKIVSYGDNPKYWRRLTKTRLQRLKSQDVAFEQAPEDAALRSKLRGLKLGGRWEFEGQLEEAIRELSEHYRIPMIIHRNVFKNPDFDSPEKRVIDVRLPGGKSLDKVLKFLLESKGLDYSIEKKAVLINNKEDIKKDTRQKVYPVSDLLVQIADFQAPNIDRLTGGDTSSASLNDDDDDLGIDDLDDDIDTILENVFQNTDADGNKSTPGANDMQSLKSFVKLITSTIAPSTWSIDEGDGNIGFIVSGKGAITVTHTEEVHKQIEDLLRGLRRPKSIMVTIETRFLKVSESFFQDISGQIAGLPNAFHNAHSQTPGHELNGTGFGANGNSTIISTSSGPARLPGFVAHRDATTTGTPTQDVIALSSTSAIDGTLGKDISTRLGSGGFTLEWSFINDSAANFIVRAARKENRSSVLDAPKITAFNNQRAFISILKAQSFIGDTNVTTTSGTGGNDDDGGNNNSNNSTASTDPVINTLRDGIVLDVRPTVSHDLKYITIEVRASTSIADLSNSIKLVTRPEQQSGSGNGGSVTRTEESATIALPSLTTASIRTTVMVPDGGTVLLGGLADLQIREGQSGAPWISKIPLLGFFFTEKGRSDSRSNLILLLRAEINIMEELEEAETGVVTR